MTVQRDISNKKAEELESRQNNMETDYLNQSIKFSNSINTGSPSPANNTNIHLNAGSLPFAVPQDISAVDIQILLSLGIKLDTQSEQQKVFDIIRQKKDITKVMEILLAY